MSEPKLKKLPKHTIPVYRRIIRCEELSLEARGIFNVLWELHWFNRYYDRQNRIEFSLRYLARVSGGVSENTISKYLTELEEKGMIKVKRRFGSSHCFKVLPAKAWKIPEIPANPDLRGDAPALSRLKLFDTKADSASELESPTSTAPPSKEKSNVKVEAIKKTIRGLLNSGDHKELPTATRRACAKYGQLALRVVLSEVKRTTQFFDGKFDGESLRKMSLQQCRKAGRLGIEDYNKDKTRKSEINGTEEYISPVTVQQPKGIRGAA